jgi:hypothetical protein
MVNSTRSSKLASALAIVVAVAAIAIQPVAAGNNGGAAQAPLAQSTATPKPTASPTPRPSATATATARATVRATATAAPRPTATKAAAAAATATKDAGIVIQPISKAANVKSYKTTVIMKLDGQSGGKVAKGDLNAVVQSIPASKKQSIAITGSLIPTLLGQYLQGMPVTNPTVYLIGNQVYVTAQALIVQVCAVPRNPIAGLEQLSSGLSADTFLAQITGSNKVPGKLVGDATINGIPTRHYKLDAAAINALAKQNKADLQLKSGDMWVAKQGDYVVRLLVDGTGNLAAGTGVDFKGNANLSLDVTDVNKVPDITLPGSCNRPIQI